MKNNLKEKLIILLSFFVLLFIYSKFGPKIPISIVSQEKGEPFIVTEEGKVTTVPDIAKINLGIEENGANLKTVQDNVNKKSKNLVTELKKLDIDEKKIKTISYNVYPQYNYDSNPPVINSYQVSTTYEVIIEDFETINDVLVKATQVGSNVIGNITFDLKEDTKRKALDEARETAVDKAKDKAKSLASKANISLGKIINISETGETNIPTPVYTRELVGIESQDLTKANIQAGETEITVIISISWEIK